MTHEPSSGFAAWVWRRPQRWFLLGIPLGGVAAFLLGAAFMGGFLGSLSYASTTTYCTSCHEMQQPKQELAQTVHFSNEFGIRAGCSDCHLPPTFFAGLVRHMAAASEVWGHLIGKLNTPAKYEAHRLAMAQSVWKELKGNDSAECRSCHTPAAMALAKQPAAASESHSTLGTSGMTCIDCHKGLAHTLPQGG